MIVTTEEKYYTPKSSSVTKEIPFDALYIRDNIFRIRYHCCPVKVPDDYYKV